MRTPANLLSLCAIFFCISSAQAQDELIEQWVQAVVRFSSTPTTFVSGFGELVDVANSNCGFYDDRDFAAGSWRPTTRDRGLEWIEVRFARPVNATAIEVYETLNPGAITRVVIIDADGNEHEVWTGEDPNRICPSVFRVDFPRIDIPANTLRIELDTAKIPGWNQIDAIKLIGHALEGFDPFFTRVDSTRLEMPSSMASYNFIDYDNDGWPDILGTVNRDVPPPFILLHNEGNERFRDRRSILSMPPTDNNAGRIFADYDNDGDLDLFIAAGSVSRFVARKDLLLRNDRGHFVNVAGEAGLTDSLLSAMAVWFDYDRDGHLDLYVGHWTYDPDAAIGLQNFLYHNNGDGTFRNTTIEAGLDLQWYLPDAPIQSGTGGGAATADFNDDGWPDLYLPIGDAPSRLMLNTGAGTFRDATNSDIGQIGAGVGVSTGDIDNDGDMDLFQPSFGGAASEGSEVYRPYRSAMFLNLGNAQFLDVTEGIGLTALAVSNLFGSRLLDFDNDGDLDLFGGAPNFLFVNNGDGTFVERTFQTGFPGVESVADFDNDGYLDIVHGRGLYRNNNRDNHYLFVDLVGTKSNRDGIGARVFATSGTLRQRRDLGSGDGWFQSDRRLHFGLGDATRIDQLEIFWPSGQIDVIHNIPTDQTIRVIEGRNAWYPAPRSVWTVEPPQRLVFGSPIEFEATVRPTLFEPSAQITSITADLSSLGGPRAVPLENLGDGRYQLQHAFTVSGESDLRDVEILVLQETSLGEYWISLSRNVDIEDDPFTAVLEDFSNMLPESFTLQQNYPNPFNSGTVIRFALGQARQVEVNVYNLAGQHVASLVEGHRQAGNYAINWDGRNNAGQALATGLYLYRLRAGDKVKTKKLMLLR